nr:retrovirus-related Pol polyprotein LINE-1 [Tanacetum cinerariifolium]
MTYRDGKLAGDLRACKDCRAYPGKACSTQHRLAFEATVIEKLVALEEDMSASNADQMWNILACTIKDAAKDSLGVANEFARTPSMHRESWWFCEEVQTKVATKLSRFKELLSCREGNQENIDMAKERYKAAKREAKEAVARAKDKAYEELYKRLDSKEGANDIYKIAKARERRRKDIGSVRYIKDEGGRTIVREGDIKKIWGEYFSYLFNQTPADESRLDGSGEVGSSSLHRHFDCYYSKINQGEVRVALQKMGRNKAVGPDHIPIEAWKCLEEEGVKWLTRLFNKIFPSAKMPNELRLSEVIPIYKNKCDTQACSNYRGIKLLSNTIKLWERVTERRKYRERQRDLHMAFLDLEKAYDSVLHELVWKTLIDKGTPSKYLKVIQDMYEGAKTRVRTIVGNTEFFPVEVSLHQGSAISPYLFTLILDELSRGIQENIPWCMIFADDIVLIAESAEGLNNRLERFEVAHQEVDIRIGDRILQPKESFRYLGSMIHRSGRIDEDVAHRIRTGWVKWRATSGVLCDRRIPLNLKGKFYRVAIRPAIAVWLRVLADHESSSEQGESGGIKNAKVDLW